MEAASRFIPFDGASGLVIDDLSASCGDGNKSFALSRKPKVFVGLVYNTTLKFDGFEQSESSLGTSFEVFKTDALYALYLV